LIRAEWFAELKAAIDERIDAAYPTLSKPTPVNSGDLVRWDRITEYRQRIDVLTPKFYYKIGSGDDVTFTAYSKAVMMTECFGEGITDWPNKNDKLLWASHWNDMMTVLNRMEWFRIYASWNYPHSAGFTNSGLPVVGDSKASAQAAFDSLSDEFQEYNESNFCGIEPVGYRSGEWGPYYPISYYLASYEEWVVRDNQAVSSINIPDVAFTDAYLAIYVKNFKGPTQRFGGEYLAPSQPLTVTFYHGTGIIPDSSSGIRSYGSQIGSWITSQLLGALHSTTLKYAPISHTTFIHFCFVGYLTKIKRIGQQIKQAVFVERLATLIPAFLGNPAFGHPALFVHCLDGFNQ